MRWVGLTGRAGAGKDHLFDRMNEMDDTFLRVSLADTLRFELEEVLGADVPRLYEKPYSAPLRAILQWYGTEYRRKQDQNYWIKRTVEVAARAARDGYKPVFTDIRFPNEARMVMDVGGFIVKVTAPDKIRKARLGQLPEEHPSETSMDRFNYHRFTIDSGKPKGYGPYEDMLKEIVHDATN